MGKLALIGVIAAMVMATQARSAPATEALIAETQAALDKGDAQHAANLADAGLNGEAVSAGQRGRLLLYRGLAEELMGFHDPAMRDFTAALDTGALPAAEQAQALLQRGFLRDGLGRLDEAARDYTAVIALKGDSLATAFNNRANIFRRQKRFSDAKRDYRAALSAAGGKPQYSWYGLGQIAEAEADPIAARGYYAKAVAADPAYALASERLEALGGPPDNAIASAQDEVVLHPPATTAVQPAREADTALSHKSKRASRPPAVQISSHTAHDTALQAPGSSARPDAAAGGVTLRPALDHAGGGASDPGLARPESRRSPVEVQLGAWRSEEEANAGWKEARLRAGSALDGFSPHIVSADLPGKGHYYRLRIGLAPGQNQTALCAALSAKGITCLPAKD